MATAGEAWGSELGEWTGRGWPPSSCTRGPHIRSRGWLPNGFGRIAEVRERPVLEIHDRMQRARLPASLTVRRAEYLVSVLSLLRTSNRYAYERRPPTAKKLLLRTSRYRSVDVRKCARSCPNLEVLRTTCLAVRDRPRSDRSLAALNSPYRRTIGGPPPHCEVIQ